MFIKANISLKFFEFWGGAVPFVSRLTGREFDAIENYLDDYYDGIIPTETDVNDIFWFESTMLIVDVLGLDEEEFWKREKTR